MKISKAYFGKIALVSILLLFAAAPAWAVTIVSISVSPSFPTTSDNVIITVSESGTHINSCSPVRLEYNKFSSGRIEITPFFEPTQNCFQASTEIDYTLSVNVGRLGAGNYTVTVFPVTSAQAEERRFSVTEFINRGTLRLESGAYTVSEADGSVSIAINRLGGADGRLSIDYQTRDLVATAGQDYTATQGTLEFLDGETTQSFEVPILPDNLTEGEENFIVVLIDTTGAFPLGFATAFVTIIDANGTAPPTGGDLAGCATFNLFTGLLRIPDFELGGTSYTLDLRLVGTSPIQYELVDYGFGQPSSRSATFDVSTAVLFAPCLNVGGSYWSQWLLVPGDTVRFQLLDFGENP